MSVRAPSLERIDAALRNALVHGCRQSRLLKGGQDLVALLVQIPADSRITRAHAQAAEHLILGALESLSERISDTLRHLVGLDPHTEGFPLKTRRRNACAAFGRDPLDVNAAYTTKHFIDKFETDLVWDLAVALSATLEGPRDPPEDLQVVSSNDHPSSSNSTNVA